MLWPLEQRRRGHALVPRLHRRGAGRAQRLLRLPDRAAGRALPGGRCTGKKMCGVVWCYTGRTAEAEAIFAPMRRVRPAALDWVRPMPYPALQSMFDALYPPGHQWYWRADFVNELDRRGDRRSTSSSAPSCRRRSRRCTSTRSTARRTASPKDATALSLPRRQMGRGDRRGRARTRPTSAEDHRLDARATGRRCTRTRPAAPTST